MIASEERHVPVQCQDVLAGKCFAASGDGDVRRVLRVRGGVVTYEARRNGRRDRRWSTATDDTLDNFLTEVSIEVGADYMPHRAAEFLYT